MNITVTVKHELQFVDGGTGRSASTKLAVTLVLRRAVQEVEQVLKKAIVGCSLEDLEVAIARAEKIGQGKLFKPRMAQKKFRKHVF